MLHFGFIFRKKKQSNRDWYPLKLYYNCKLFEFIFYILFI
jgi:hypothetical protein